ncbi:MAG: hypothetical protein HQK51_16145 [Oligoflexia bacterium]|nr:hypothetical protein [Oligoflexia bacterium]
MKVITYLKNYQQLTFLDSIDLTKNKKIELELILSTKELSLLGILNLQELIFLAKECKKRSYISKIF